MVQTIGRILGRVMIILLAAGIVAGGVYALSQSAFGAGPAGFPGGPRDSQAQFVGAPPGQGQTAPDGSAAILDNGWPLAGRSTNLKAEARAAAPMALSSSLRLV